MRFSFRELGQFFAKPLPPVEQTAEALIAHAFEVEEIIPKGDDWELEIKVLPDRGNDAKNPLGLARELSSVLDQPLKDNLAPLPTKETARARIIFSAEDISHLLGLALGEHEISDYLKRVRVVVVEDEGNRLMALVPPERLDINIKEDLADEVARLHGYDKLPARFLKTLDKVEHNADFVLANKVRELLVTQGYTEIYGYTFTDHGEVEVEKPLASDKAFLRTNLTDGMKKYLEFNLQHILFDKDEVKLFEIGNVFVGGAEEIRVAIGHAAKKPKQKIEVVEHGLSDMAGQVENLSGDLQKFVKPDVNYKPFSNYPRIIRDVAVFVPVETDPEAVKTLIKDAAGELLVEDPALFDNFQKGERKSLAFRLVLQSYTKTLSDAEANEVMSRVAKNLEKEPNFEVRK